MVTEEEVLARIDAGKLIEGPEHASEGYLKALKRTLVVSGDTEMISAPAYMRAAQDAPNLGAYMTETGAIQDELGHAHIAYRMLADLGEDMDALVYEREPKKWKYPYAFDVPLDTWLELVVANGLYDRAGYVLLGDIHNNSSFGPWKRALAKVEKEETFHLRHGERWMKIFAADPERRDELQRALDWMFVLTLEWFGLPDDLKRHDDQLKYRIKGFSNDQLRQNFMSTAVPLCEKLGMDVPAHYDENEGKYVIDCPFPMAFDSEEKRWDYDGGEISWDDVIQRWRPRGPMNEEYVARIQRGYKQLAEKEAA